jgi:hypothetical protein
LLHKPSEKASEIAGNAPGTAGPAPGAGDKKPEPPAKAPGASAAAPPAPRPVADAAAAAAWDAKLRDRARTLVASGTRLVFRVSPMESPVTLLGVADTSLNMRMEGGGRFDAGWPQLKPGDKRSLALAIVSTTDQPEDHALAAFHLLLDGDSEKADHHLARAGRQAAEVRAAFGLKET